MAEDELAPYVAGPCKILIKTSGGYYDDAAVLGYTRDGVGITTTPRFLPIHTDQHGGRDGDPVDLVFLSESVTIHAELVEFYPAVIDRLLRWTGMPTTTDATTIKPGRLMLQSGVGRSLTVTVVRAEAEDDTYLARIYRAVMTTEATINVGSKYSTAVVRFTGYRDISFRTESENRALLLQLAENT